MADLIQEQIINARRNQILDAAAATFSKKGFHSTTVKDVAAEAGVSNGTIYNYFANKSALLIGIFDRMQQSVQQPDASMLGDLDLRSFMRLFLSQPLMTLRANNFELFRIVIGEMMVSDELRELYQAQILQPTILLAEHALEKWIAKGLLEPLDIGLTVRAISGMVLGLMVQSILGDPLLDAKWAELPDFLTRLVIDGMEQLH